MEQKVCPYLKRGVRHNRCQTYAGDVMVPSLAEQDGYCLAREYDGCEQYIEKNYCVINIKEVMAGGECQENIKAYAGFIS
jgi:hypothetical protein